MKSELSSITVASYNIQHGVCVEYNWLKLAFPSRYVQADLLGLQEVDMYTNRSRGLDTVRDFSEAASFPATVYMPTMSFDGGQYGIAQFSRFPIEESHCISLMSGNLEPRVCGHALLRLNGRPFHFFNTHLSYESREARIEQMAEISRNLPYDEPFVLTGDFNTSDLTEFRALLSEGNGYRAAVNLTDRVLKTFRTNPDAIDNIVYSSDFLHLSDCGMVDSSASDHNLLWARFTLI